MIRLHLDAADLRRITLAPAPNALFETALSVRGLRTGTTAQGRARPAVDQWRRRVNGSLAERAGVLLDLVPRDGYLPDFLLQPSAGDFATAVDLAGRTPSELLVKDLRIADSPGHDGGPVAPSQWSRELAAGSAAARHTLMDDLRRYYTSSIAPLWPQVRTDATADRVLRAEMLLRGGVDALLTTLSPTWLWDPPTLHLPSRSSYDIPLCGRGLLLMPSWFATGPMIMYRPEESTVLTYPMHLPDAPAGRPRCSGRCSDGPAPRSSPVCAIRRRPPRSPNASASPWPRPASTPPCCATRGWCARPGSASRSCTASLHSAGPCWTASPRPLSAKTDRQRSVRLRGRVGPAARGMRASSYRAEMIIRFAIGDRITGVAGRSTTT